MISKVTYLLQRTLVPVCLVMMLFGCSAKQPLPLIPECPDLDLGELERAKPYGAMVEGQGFPVIPADMATLTGEQQAHLLVQVVSKAAESYGTCELNRRTLIDWIVNEPIPEDE